MTKKIKTLVISATSSDDRFLDLARTVPGELLPLGDLPAVQHVVEDALFCGVEDVVIITSPEKKSVFDHFTSLKEIYGKDTSSKNKYSSVSFSNIVQKKKTNSAYTVSRAEKSVSGEPFFLFSLNCVLASKTPSSVQLFNVFRTSEKPVIGLCFDESVPYTYVAETEKIANRLYKINKIVEKKKAKKGMPGVIGRYILTGTVFDYLKSLEEKDTLTHALARMLGDGKAVYGCELEGKWFSFYDHRSYLKSVISFSVEHSSYSEEIKSQLL